VYLCSSFVADGALVMPGCQLGMGSLVGVQSVIQAYSTLAEGSVWAGTPAICLDPGVPSEESAPSSSSKGLQRRNTSTRWQRAQSQLSMRPNSKVLSSRGLVPMKSARLLEGTTNLNIILEDEDEDEEVNMERMSLSSGSMSRRGLLRRRSTASTSSSLTWSSTFMSRRMSTQRALTSRSLARTNTFQRPELAAFSQASMIIEGLEDVIGDRKEYSESLLLVPCVIVPAWLLAALLVPVYLVDATARSSSLATACTMIPLAAPILGECL